MVDPPKQNANRLVVPVVDDPAERMKVTWWQRVAKEATGHEAHPIDNRGGTDDLACQRTGFG